MPSNLTLLRRRLRPGRTLSLWLFLPALLWMTVMTGDGTAARESRIAARAHILPALLKRTQEAFKVYQQGRYSDSRALYFDIARDARKERHTYTELYARDMAAICAFSAFDYHNTVLELLTVRTEAERHQFFPLLASVDAAIASAHSQMGDLAAARSAADHAIAGVDPANWSNAAIDVLLVAGAIAGGQRDFEAARGYFDRAIGAATGSGDLAQEAKTWHLWGEEMLTEKKFPEAAEALARAYRIRKLQKDRRAASSLLALARAEHGLGRNQQASELFDLVLADATHSSSLPAWLEYYRRGMFRRDVGRLREALDDFATSFRYAREWRLGVLPSENARIGAEVRLEDVASAYVETAFDLRSQTGDAVDATRQALEIAEQVRTSSLRQSLVQNRILSREKADEYAALLSRLRQAEGELASHRK